MLIHKIGKVYEVKGFVLGTFVGATVAGLTALLLAPKSGEEVRGDIKERTLKTKEQALDAMNKAKEKGHDLKESIDGKKADYLEDASASYDQLTEQVGSKVDESKDNLDKLKEEAKNTADNVKGKLNKEQASESKNDPTAPSATSSTLEYDYDKDTASLNKEDNAGEETHTL